MCKTVCEISTVGSDEQFNTGQHLLQHSVERACNCVAVQHCSFAHGGPHGANPTHNRVQIWLSWLQDTYNPMCLSTTLTALWPCPLKLLNKSRCFCLQLCSASVWCFLRLPRRGAFGTQSQSTPCISSSNEISEGFVSSSALRHSLPQQCGRGLSVTCLTRYLCPTLVSFPTTIHDVPASRS